jgi:protein SCO1/2
MTNLPTNWHFFSITIDPEFDTPEVLKSYAQRYQYDPKHWSFLTGPNDRVQRLGKLFGMTFDPDGNLLKHSFRTVVINRSNVVQQIFPVAGDFSEELAQEMIKALGRTNIPKQNSLTGTP